MKRLRIVGQLVEGIAVVYILAPRPSDQSDFLKKSFSFLLHTALFINIRFLLLGTKSVSISLICGHKLAHYYCSLTRFEEKQAFCNCDLIDDEIYNCISSASTINEVYGGPPRLILIFFSVSAHTRFFFSPQLNRVFANGKR